MRKKVDSRIRTLVENGVKLNERTLFVVVGDRAREQVVNLHYMLSKAVVKSRPNVLWCYKKELYLSSHKKKRVKQIKKMVSRGLMDPENEDPFSLFVASTDIKYTYYADTQKILGNTYGMAVLQDFEALTPNLLARTVETVEGGGIIVLLLSNLESLSQLYTLTMDVHARFRTESHQHVTARFNERFILSLGHCPTCIMMDDELNILPISSHVRDIQPVGGEIAGAADPEDLADLKRSLQETEPAGPLVSCCKTLDQAKAVVTFLDAASEKTLRSTVALTAARGRGKSAAMGIAVAGAIGMGYANVFVTSPSPENLNTFFRFVLKGFDALGYKEHLDYDLVESSNPAFGKAIVRVNVTRAHRQTIQYILPQHAERATQAELLVIDEAAAIPLPTVQKLLGPYLVFLCSTVNGYEGTGRALSLKLISNLRKEAAGAAAGGGGGAAQTGRLLREVQLAEPVRYSFGDRVEGWLNGLLCLDAADATPPLTGALPPPSACDLFEVNRDTLFSAHRASELFLKRMMSLYVASHYKNTPNDLQLMADAPAHRLFVLLAPVDETANALPEILCVLQVALEGAISRGSASAALSKGDSPQGDLVPWTVATQFQDPDFPQLSGARIVRIATHPDLPRQGYGSRALQQLHAYYEGALTDLLETDVMPSDRAEARAEVTRPDGGLLGETIKPRAALPPLLSPLGERRPEKCHWIAAAFGLTQQLHKFWTRAGYQPVYLRQTASDATGEHSAVLIRALESSEDDEEDQNAPSTNPEWLRAFSADFKQRFTGLLGGPFRDMPPGLALAVLAPKVDFDDDERARGCEENAVRRADGDALTAHDLKRLEKYAQSLVDHHLVADLVPPLARAFFGGKIPATMSYAQTAIVLTLGLQHKEMDDAANELGLPTPQVMALFNKAVRKMHAALRAGKTRQVEAEMPERALPNLNPHAVGLDEDLEDG
jgi:N-acetyltransferase 10